MICLHRFHDGPASVEAGPSPCSVPDDCHRRSAPSERFRHASLSTALNAHRSGGIGCAERDAVGGQSSGPALIIRNDLRTSPMENQHPVPDISRLVDRHVDCSCPYASYGWSRRTSRSDAGSASAPTPTIAQYFSLFRPQNSGVVPGGREWNLTDWINATRSQNSRSHRVEACS